MTCVNLNRLRVNMRSMRLLILMMIYRRRWRSINQVVRSVSVLGDALDTTPPTVDHFEINSGAIETVSQAVTLSVSASDPAVPAPSTGVSAVDPVEYEYNEGAGLWVPVQTSDWMLYTTTPVVYDWNLLPAAGVKYLQVWASDTAGNISTTSLGALINYLPAQEDLLQGASRYYLFTMNAGETFTASLTPTSGDPDLYVWSPSGETSWFSINDGSAVDAVSFVTTEAGTYIVQVYGYSESSYALAVGVGSAVTSEI